VEQQKSSYSNHWTFSGLICKHITPGPSSAIIFSKSSKYHQKQMGRKSSQQLWSVNQSFNRNFTAFSDSWATFFPLPAKSSFLQRRKSTIWKWSAKLSMIKCAQNSRIQPPHQKCTCYWNMCLLLHGDTKPSACFLSRESNVCIQKWIIFLGNTL